jgi:hypothetical protein
MSREFWLTSEGIRVLEGYNGDSESGFWTPIDFNNHGMGHCWSWTVLMSELKEGVTKKAS